MSDAQSAAAEVDVLIVGSGPIGAAFARVIAEKGLAVKILMVDLGPQLTARPGVHTKNIADEEERSRAQIRSQGPTQYPYAIPSIAERVAAAEEKSPGRAALLARPGTHLVNPSAEDLDRTGMPAAALSSNVGGMGVHWTCACPRPGNSERVAFIPEAEWDRLCGEAERILCVTQAAYPESVEGFAIRETLGQVFNATLPEQRPVQPMPLAVQLRDGNRYWTGPEVVLGPLADAVAAGEHGNFELRPETLCLRVLTAGARVTGALLEHLPSGNREEVRARIVVVAADALRTPQLLWASGIRPAALGHYLNDQPQLMAGVELKPEIVERTRARLSASSELANGRRLAAEPTIGVFWVPFHDSSHPFHGQIMHSDASPIPLEATEAHVDPRHIVGLGWFTTKEVRYEDYIEFSETETDFHGMPKMTIHYELTAKDLEAIAAARKEQARAAAAFGRVLKDDESSMVPPGSSLHYQGSTRMGVRDDAESVCDPYSRVWGLANLYVGGNGVIPTATACNPTLTSVAFAVRAAEQIAETLS